MCKIVNRLCLMIGLLLSAVAKGEDIADMIVNCEITNGRFNRDLTNVTVCVTFSPKDNVDANLLLERCQKELYAHVSVDDGVGIYYHCGDDEIEEINWSVTDGNVQAEITFEVTFHGEERFAGDFLFIIGFNSIESANMGRLKIKKHHNGACEGEVVFGDYDDILIDRVVSADKWLSTKHLWLEHDFVVRFEYDLSTINDALWGYDEGEVFKAVAVHVQTNLCAETLVEDTLFGKGSFDWRVGWWQTGEYAVGFLPEEFIVGGYIDKERLGVRSLADLSALGFFMVTLSDICAHNVTFEVGDVGEYLGGGELTQTIPDGQSAIAPKVLSKDNHSVFTGWDKTFDYVTNDLQIVARYQELSDDVVVHSGEISTNETWTADKVHLIVAETKILSDVRVLIERNAVVKFMSGTELRVVDGGECIAQGVIFTHVNDDTIGGDVLSDGDMLSPKAEDYRITGIVTDDDATEYRYRMLTVEVCNVRFRQRYPWNGLVDIDFFLNCSDSATYISLVVSAKDKATGKNLLVRNIWLENDASHTNALVVQHGEHRLVWDARADIGQAIYSNIVVRVGYGDAYNKVQLWEGGPYWAKMNIGAEEPEDYGYYFWWGDTVGYKREGNAWVATDGSSFNFSFGSSNTPTCNKNIAALQSEGWVVSQGDTYVLAPEYDAAQVQWGGAWRMPTYQELYDLCNTYCDWVWTSQNGKNGYMVRGRGDYASASIFLPCAGYGNGTSLDDAGSYGRYWSSVPGSGSSFARYLHFNSGSHNSGDGLYRERGRSVRPVQGAGEAGESAPSSLIIVDGVRIEQNNRIVSAGYSSRWGNAESCTVAADGETVKTAMDEGVFEWTPNGVGTHTLTHTAGDLVYTAQFVVLGDDVVVHAGTLSTNEIWSADKVHLVTATVTVPSGVSLLIEPGAVVKFMPGTSLVVENGGTCTAIGVVFTHANDDTMQGDTLFDGETAPVQDDYKIVVRGNMTEDDTTEYRYMAPQELTSSITSNIRLRGHRVYVVSNDVTVASGATLTIQPGALLKFASGKSLTVNSGGTLNAQGTRALPIVFTSLKDDAHGGDTNGDGESYPSPNDWRSVKVSGRATFDNVKMLYGGGVSSSSDSGMLIGNSGGTISLSNCMLAHGMYDAIFTYAKITAENCALYDCDRGVNAVGGSVTMKNCVVDMCRWGVMAEGGTGRFYNCSITRFYGSPSWPTGYGVSLWSGGSLTVKNCNVWTDSASGQNYLRFTGTSCISADPRFVSADAGDFRLLADSPCIDAGDGTVAPATDWFGQTRQTVYEDAKGMPDAKGNYPDIGIHEVMPREVKSDIDLAAENVSAPELLAVGQEMIVYWMVKNLGTETVSGSWMDKVELVCANGAVVEVGTVATSATLPADGSRTFSGKFKVPSAQVGNVKVRVTTNANRDIFEGTLTANNSTESEVATLTMPELAFPESGVASFSVTAGRSVGYRLGDGFAEGGLLIVHAESAKVGGVKVWTGNGQVPTADIFYAAAVEVGGGDYLVRVPPGGDAYVAFANEGSGIAKVEVGTEAGAFLLFDTGVVTAPNAGTASLTIFGNGFDDGMEVWIEKGGMRVGASEVVIFDPVKAVATFDVTGLAAGAYEVHVKKGDAEAAVTLLSLTETRIGPKWSCKLDIATSVRSSREYVGYLEYANTGDMPLDAPYVKITSGSGSFIRFGTADAWGDTLELMAVSEAYPASQLKPGEKRRIPFRYKTTGSSLSVECGYTQQDAGAFPWDTNASYMRPSWASDELWGLSLAVLKSNVGATWNDYLARMRANCDHLAKIGQPTYRLDRIWQLEINEALGVDHAVSTLASNTDLARSGRGFGLALSRSYGSGLYRRLRKGIFGYGWSDNYSAYAELQNSGATLALHSGSGSTYLFEKVNGKWSPEDARDKTTCTETSTEYVLKYRSGTEQRIAKSSMRVTSVKDNQGNALTFTYNADKQLVKVEHCDGQSLSFTYANGLLVSAADDQGRTTTYEYSGDMLVKVTAFNGLSTQYRYLAADGSVTSRALRQIVYADGTTHDYTYDGAGHVATVSINGNLQMVEIVRGALGSYSVIAPNGGETTVLLGASGEVLETVNALGQKSTRTYTADTLLEAVVGPTGKRAKIGYDEDGQAVKATDAAGADTHFAYTSDFGNLAKVTDARGNSFDYGYDKLGRSKSISYADGSIESIAYNDRGDVTSSINRRGQSITFTYDDEGNTLSKVWDNGRTFTWSYDAKGNCTNATDSVTGTVTMEYDENERLTRIVHPKGRGFVYEYDELGRTVSRTTLGGTGSVPSAADIQRYTYDALGRLSRMTDGDGNLYVENSYDPTTGWLITQTYGNGTIVSNAYDILGRTIGIYHGRAVSMKPPYLAFFEYEYDVEGRRISQTTAEGVERYTYDTVGQLTDVYYPDGTEEHFTYDAVGNRIFHTGTTGILPVEETYTANNLNQYTSVDDTSLAYDLDGNMTRKGDTFYYYDIQNRLVAVTNETMNIRWSCEYDVFGNRLRVTDNGTTKETLFVQGSLASAVAEFDASGDLSTRHILLGFARVADWESRHLGGGDENTIRYYHSDGLASTRLLTDANGDTIGTASYRAFGDVRATSGDTTSAGWVGTLGVERDDATGLVFMRNRYYDAEQGRFIQMDPIGLNAGDFNVYRYCENCSSVYVDSDGLATAMPSAPTASGSSTSCERARAHLENSYNKPSTSRGAPNLGKAALGGAAAEETTVVAGSSVSGAVVGGAVFAGVIWGSVLYFEGPMVIDSYYERKVAGVGHTTTGKYWIYTSEADEPREERCKKLYEERERVRKSNLGLGEYNTAKMNSSTDIKKIEEYNRRMKNLRCEDFNIK